MTHKTAMAFHTFLFHHFSFLLIYFIGTGLVHFGIFDGKLANSSMEPVPK